MLSSSHHCKIKSRTTQVVREPYPSRRSHFSGDRFIPLRWGRYSPYKSFHYGSHTTLLGKVDLLKQGPKDYSKREYIKHLQSIWGLPTNEDKVFSYKDLPFVYVNNKVEKHWLVVPRQRPKTPMPKMTLDLPDFTGGFYYNQLDWGSSDCIAAWINGCVYIWNVYSSSSRKFKIFETDTFCSAVRFDITGKLLAVGTSKSQLELWSIKKTKMYHVMNCYCKPFGECSINCVEWHPTKNFLVSGCSNGYVCTVSTETFATKSVMRAQNGQVALIRSSPSGSHLALCGESTVLICQWQDEVVIPFLEVPIQVPTRAIAWHPWHLTLLAVGSESTVSVINVSRRVKVATWLASIPCNVDALSFSSRTGELVVSIWILEDHMNSPEGCKRRVLVLSSLDQVEDWLLSGNEDSSRTVSLMWSSDGRYVAIASSEETLLIWNFLGEKSTKNHELRKEKTKLLCQDLYDTNNCLFSIR